MNINRFVFAGLLRLALLEACDIFVVSEVINEWNFSPTETPCLFSTPSKSAKNAFFLAASLFISSNDIDIGIFLSWLVDINSLNATL